MQRVHQCVSGSVTAAIHGAVLMKLTVHVSTYCVTFQTVKLAFSEAFLSQDRAGSGSVLVVMLQLGANRIYGPRATDRKRQMGLHGQAWRSPRAARAVL